MAVVYNPSEKTTLRLSLGKAFRPPTVYELYCTWSYAGKTYACNPDLKPETTISWDTGVNQRLWKGAKLGLTYFENYIEDLIYNKTVSATYERINVGKAESKGVEFEVEQRFEKGLRLFSNFTYTNGMIKENEAATKTVGKRLTQTPQKMFNLGAEFEKGGFSTSLVGRYVSKRYSKDDNSDVVNNVYMSYDPYFVTDAKLSYNFKQMSASL